MKTLPTTTGSGRDSVHRSARTVAGSTPRTAARRLAALLTAAAAAVALAAGPAALPASGAQAAGLTSDAVDRYVRHYVERTGLPGAVVAVTEGERVVHTAGYGHTAAGQPMTSATRVPVASLSKAMTAIAVVQLAEEGRVDLDQPVHRYLPEFTMADPRAEQITVGQLLTQTSGMADSAYPDLTRAQPRTLEEAVAAMRGAHLAAAPGTRFSYHNPNYFVAARLVEAVSGQEFGSRLTERIFGPLGMTHTTSVAQTLDMPEQARGYVRAYGTLVARPHPRWFTEGAFGVVTTADDLSRWLITQNDQGRTADGRRIVSPSGIDLTHTPPGTPDDARYAMGWTVENRDGGPVRLQHTGQLLTHNSMAVLLPSSRVGIAVVTNTGMVSGDDAQQIAEGLVAVAQGKHPEVEEPFTMTADWVLLALTVLALALGLRGCLRAGRWAERTVRRPWWQTALRVLPYGLVIAFFTQLANLLGLLFNRSGTLAQAAYAWPALFVCAAVGALAGGVVLLVRSCALLLRWRAGRTQRGLARLPQRGRR
ncbi:serine hydrolase domain-containing protein [Kitasatospora sp. NPDC005856]|uniref:serine hydrolase domain-containing protein n=1 Tax=Kitasatospora sp. NPDC005856 TaxID=3154566 RepID=UPI0033C4FF52